VSQNSDTTAPSGREPYHLQFSLQVGSLETFGYTFIYSNLIQGLISGLLPYSHLIQRYETSTC